MFRFSKLLFLLHVLVCLFLIGFVLYTNTKHWENNQFEIALAKAGEKLYQKGGSETVDSKLKPLDVNLKVLNVMGHPWTTLKLLRLFLEHRHNPPSLAIISRMRREASEIREKLEQKNLTLPRLERVSKQADINIAFIACGSFRREQAKVLIKSILTFALDAKIHLIAFSDSETILELGQDLLTLKWTMNVMGYDFTYELHLTWFPGGEESPWKTMYSPCATQRLFFPSLLNHIDSLIYLDTDVIVVSNLTSLWDEITLNMRDVKMVGLAPNSAETMPSGWYWSGLKIPYYGKTGVNAGIMLMNLTQLRKFGFEERALASYKLYKEEIYLADQDIINIIFHGFPDKLLLLSCSYNFNWIHCGWEGYNCTGSDGVNFCFCSQAQSEGLKIVHGNSGTFTSDYVEHTFLPRLYLAFERMDLMKDLRPSFFKTLKTEFRALAPSPCPPLTADLMYHNGQVFLQDLNLQFLPSSQFFNSPASAEKMSFNISHLDMGFSKNTVF